MAFAESLKVKGELDPFGLAGLGMKVEFAGGTVNSCEKLEELKGLEVNSSQIAFMYSCHIDLTVERAPEGLQNGR